VSSCRPQISFCQVSYQSFIYVSPQKEIETQIRCTIICNNYFTLNALDPVNCKSNICSIREESSMNKKNMNSINGYLSLMCGKETKFMINLFRNTKFNISYKIKNTVEKHLAYKQQECTTEYNGNGIYTLKRPDCRKHYLGQTSDPSKLDLKNILSLINIKIPNTRNILRVSSFFFTYGKCYGISTSCRKGNFMNVLEKFYICKETHLNNQLNDKST